MMVIGCAVVALMLIGLGIWGRRAVPDLVPRSLGVQEREHKMRSMRRGTTACFLGAAVLLYFVIDSLL